jgi:NADH:ubiquinone oxidoreductase subunit 6 (subunit J)
MAQIKKPTGTSGNASHAPLLFGKRNYLYFIAGAVLILCGFFAMAGGSMPSPDVWDESLIYSPVRITVAPVLILSGLVLCGVSIFVKNK